MPLSVKLVSGPRLLETAFHASKSKAESPAPTQEATVDLYNKFFAPLPGAVQGKPFERFSLIDPTIRTFIASTTDTTR